MKNTEEKDSYKFCENCRFAKAIHCSEEMLCDKKGIVHKEGSCRKFIYDPLKREPRKAPVLTIPDDLADGI